jgi:hypothetical protein
MGYDDFSIGCVFREADGRRLIQQADRRRKRRDRPPARPGVESPPARPPGFTIRFYRPSGADWVALGSAEFDGRWVVVRVDPPDLDPALVGDTIVALCRDNVAFGTASVGGVRYRWREV